MKIHNIKGFSLVEVLVAAAVILLAVFSVVAIIRKGQEQLSVDTHRRTARAIVDTLLEAEKYLPGNYLSITNSNSSVAITLDSKTNLQATKSFIIEDKQYTTAVSDFSYKRIWAKLKWTELVGGAVDSVEMEKWVPNIRKPNIAPMALTVTSPTPFNDCNILALVANCPFNCACLGWHGVASSPEIYYANPWCAVDGIIGGRINGDWADNNTSNPLDIQWGTTHPHKINKIVLFNRSNPGGAWAEGAQITLFRNGGSVGTITTRTGFSNGSVVPVFISPTVVDEIQVVPTPTGHSWPGMSEVEVYE